MNDSKSVKKIHKILNHKQKEQTYYEQRKAGKFSEETNKVVDEVVNNCEICKGAQKTPWYLQYTIKMINFYLKSEVGSPNIL